MTLNSLKKSLKELQAVLNVIHAGVVGRNVEGVELLLVARILQRFLQCLEDRSKIEK